MLNKRKVSVELRNNRKKKGKVDWKRVNDM